MSDGDNPFGFTAQQVLWLARVLGVMITPPAKARLPDKKVIIGSAQKERATKLFKLMTVKDRKRYEAIIKNTKSEDERDYVTKALGTSHSMDEIEAFAKKIEGKDVDWLQNNLKLTGSTTGTGVKQQWSHSCNATTVQAVQAELDPVYALKLHEENKDVSAADDFDANKVNPKLAAEQIARIGTKGYGQPAGGNSYHTILLGLAQRSGAYQRDGNYYYPEGSRALQNAVAGVVRSQAAKAERGDGGGTGDAAATPPAFSSFGPIPAALVPNGMTQGLSGLIEYGLNPDS